MEWNQPLFEIFMCVVVGNLLFISTKLAFSKEKIQVEAKSRNKRKDDPVDDRSYCSCGLASKAHTKPDTGGFSFADDPAEGNARSGNDEVPPVS